MEQAEKEQWAIVLHFKEELQKSNLNAIEKYHIKNRLKGALQVYGRLYEIDKLKCLRV